jgi:hypothetical protein
MSKSDQILKVQILRQQIRMDGLLSTTLLKLVQKMPLKSGTMDGGREAGLASDGDIQDSTRTRAS